MGTLQPVRMRRPSSLCSATTRPLGSAASWIIAWRRTSARRRPRKRRQTPVRWPQREMAVEPAREGSSSGSIRALRTRGMAPSEPTPTSMPTRPSVTVTWRPSCGLLKLLMQLSEVLTKWRQFFYQIAAQQGQAGLPATETKLEVAMLQKSLENMGIAVNTDFQSWFTEEMQGLSGTVDLLNWNSLIDNRTKFSKLLLVPNMQTGQLEPLLAHFTEEEDLQLKRILHRTEVLAKRAREVGVRLMMDAEQTYFQPAISHLTVELQRKFNTEKPLIFGTHQCYLKDAYDNVSLDVELARREGWCFGTKLVRGAYMTQERDRAAALGYEDPINPTYEATSTMYHRCLSYVLEEIKHHNQANVMVASHNEDTVKFAIQRMREMGLHPSEKKVSFGQLLSMCDHISFPLGQAGFPVYKYVPFGPVKEVLPYLSRRALENRGIMKGVQRERKLMRTELKRRLFSGNFFYRPKAC
ncbi:proline dehydrogenase 1, mitochondrial-like isoform X2 [Trichosurus vulpecula]|uniref:proline dehydrogenase 1, mitochondrial-like isoform X2 n=1 Tax=Trichosurus vulpecula TaxID=9337 RepID=UPI00186AD0B8|nr:proline dehydrogenase 1, mitochondrial-like isoform X2 [Trichosurus vulpecula]